MNTEVTEVMNGETKEKVMKIVEEQLPGVHAELFTRYIHNSEEMKKELKVLETAIEGMRDDLCERDNTIQSLNEKIEILEGLRNKKEDLDHREAELQKASDAFRKDSHIRDHNLAMAKLKADMEKEKTEQAERMFNTIFKPAILRKSVQEVIPRKVKQSGYVQTDYDNQGHAVYTPVDGGENIENTTHTITGEETEE